ncbi:MAG: polyprenyl synthetase family protein [Pseudomonadota bacterium]
MSAVVNFPLKPIAPQNPAVKLVDAAMSKLAEPTPGQVTTQVHRAVRSHFASGGGRTRATMALEAASALDLSTSDAVCIASAAELLHNASLIHDDIQDRSTRRRGRESLWVSFGDDVATCAGDLLISAAYEAVTTISSSQMVGLLVSTMHKQTARVIHGQALDIRYKQHIPDFTTYKKVASEKSGPLLGLPIELALVVANLSSYKPFARQAATQLAIAYQIADDIDDALIDSGTDTQSACLNAVNVFKASGINNPKLAASYHALTALIRSARAAQNLPRHSGLPILNVVEVLLDKLEQLM